MPPEPLPWDRKDFGFKERKDQIATGSALPPPQFQPHNGYPLSRWVPPPDFRRPPGDRKEGFFKERKNDVMSLPRWRESPSSYHNGPRDGFRSAEFRRPPGGHDRQMFPEEFGHGYGPSRPDGRIMEDHGFRSYGGRNNRDVRGFGPRDWRDTLPPTLSGPVKQHDGSGDRNPEPSRSEFVDSDHVQLKDQRDKIFGVDGSSDCRESSLGTIDWKPLKWTRSGSMSARGSNEAKAELQPKDASFLQSPVENVAASVTSSLPEETTSNKKPRLGWGEGLAKYEKKKPSGNVERSLSNLAERSPRILGSSECASPATPSSVACSSSAGLEEKMYLKASKVDKDVCNSYGSPSPGAQNHLEELSYYLEKLETSISCLGYSVIESLQTNEPTSLDSSSEKSTAMNKLLSLKGDILKELEMTESQIDLLENKLKSPRSNSLVEDDAKPGTDQHPPSGTNSHPTGPTTLHVIPSRDVIVDNTLLGNDALEEIHPDVKDVDADSPGTATSKVAEPFSRKNSVTVKNDKSSGNLFDASSGCVQTKRLVFKSLGGDTAVSAVKEVILEKQGSGRPDSDGSNDADDLCNSILSANRVSAEKAFKELDKLLPSDVCESSIQRLKNLSGLQNGSLIEKKFMMQKKLQRFKERVLSIKYKFFRHMWKQDLHVLSIKKQRARSQKKSDLSLHHVQKRKASICLRLPSTGTSSRVPFKTEIIDFTKKLLQDSHDNLCRNTLKMPELILDERNVSRFISTNGLVEDPCAVESERSLINPWTTEEKEVFMDKLTEFGKDFRKIASFLKQRTTADCVEFYYKNHKADCFAKTKRQDLKKQAMYSTNTYLMTAGKKWNNAVNRKVPGTISKAAAHADDTIRRKKPCSSIMYARCGESISAQCDDNILERSNSYDTLRHERETLAADVLAGMCASVMSQPITSCISSSVEWRHRKVKVMGNRSLTTDITEDASDESCSDDSSGVIDFDYWNDEEKSIFLQAFASYGKDFSKISRSVKTKSIHQCKVFFSKARKILGLDSMRSGSEAAAASPSRDGNGGGSDMDEDGCAVQAGSIAGSDKSGSGVEKLNNVNHLASASSAKIDVKVELELLGETKSNDIEGVGDKDAKVVKSLAPHLFQSEVPHMHKKAIASIHAGDGEVQSTDRRKFVAESVPLNDAVNPSASSSDSVDSKTDGGEKVRDGTGSELEVSEVLVCDDHLKEMNGRLSTYNNGIVKCESCLFGTEQDCNSNTVRVSLIGCSKRVHKEHGSRKLARVEQPKIEIGSVPQEGETAIQDSLSSTRDQDNRDKQQCHDVGGDEFRQEQLSHSISNQVESCKTLQAQGGLPTSNEIKREMFENNILVQSGLKFQKSFTGQYNANDSYLKRCRSSKPHSSALETPLPSKSIDEMSGDSRPPLQSSSDLPPLQSLSDFGKPSTTRDIRLFGQILNQTPSEENPSTIVQLGDEISLHKHNKYKSSKLKFTRQQSAAGSSTPRFDCSNNLANEKFPINQVYWDGKRMQSFSLPDSQILLAKYPAAFGNYTSSAKILQQSLQPVARSSEHGLNGASVFSTLESSGSNGVVDFQRYGIRDHSQAHPFKVVMQQPQAAFSEMQRYNSFEAMSGLQQQERVGMDVVGGGGIIVGGLCTAVQDPVAAIRMHYANADKFGGPSGSIRREEESWGAGS